MKQILSAHEILRNVRTLKGFRTGRELAGFFGVGASSITDWVARKGDRIPARRLMEASRRHGLRWQWLAYGEGPPYESEHVDVATGVALDPAEVELLGRIKASTAFRKAVDRLLDLDEDQVRLLGQLAESLSSARREPPASKTPSRPARDSVLTWRSGFPLTKPR